MQKSLYGYRPAWKRNRCLTKTLLVMKLTFVLLIVFVFSAGARGLAQNVTYSGTNIKLEDVFTELEKQTGYYFLYTKQALENAQPVSFSVKDMPLMDFLKQIFEHQPLTYTIASKTITISPAPLLPATIPAGIHLYIPPVSISGRITDMNGVAISGASVTVKGTSKGVSAGTDGRFSLTSIPDGALIVFSAIGYVTIHVRILNNALYKIDEDGKSELAGNGALKDQLIRLKRSNSQLDETVVVAYGATTRRMATGSIGTVTGEEINRTPVTSLQQALQGRVPGLEISFSNGRSTAPVKVEIRGRNSLNPNAYSDPLYVLDGVPLNPVVSTNTLINTVPGIPPGAVQSGYSYTGGQNILSFINPRDIESINVLKDADATAMYGSRGANGVILITTKRGKPGPTTVNANASYGIISVPKKIKLMSTAEYLAMRREAFRNDGIIPSLDNAIDLVKWDANRETDWQDYVYGKGSMLRSSVSMSGGNASTTYNMGLNYSTTEELMNFSGKSNSGGFNLNLDHKSSNQKFNINFTSSVNLANNTAYEIFNDIFLPPNAPAPFNKDGELNFSEWRGSLASYYPFGGMFRPNTSKTTAFMNSLRLNYQLFKGLSAGVRLGMYYTDNDNTTIAPMGSQDPNFFRLSMSIFGKSTNKNLDVIPSLQFIRYIGKGTLDIFAAVEYVNNTALAKTMIGLGFPNDNLIRSINNAMAKNISESMTEYRHLGIFTSIKYDYENKYILNINLRRDGSSRFAPGKRFGNFGSVSGTWLFTEEKWIKKILPSWINFGKLTASYGFTGSDGVGDYQYLSRWSINATSTNTIPGYGDIPSIRIMQPVNQQYQWESTAQANFALHLGFRDILNLSITHYRKYSGNQLLSIPTPLYTGFDAAKGNLDAMVRNTGWEITLDGKLVNSKDITVMARFNISKRNNKLTKFPGLLQSPYATTYKVGDNINTKYYLHYLGVDPASGEPVYEDHNHDGFVNISESFIPGDPNADSYVAINTYDPKYEGGFGFTVYWNGLELGSYCSFRNITGNAPFLNNIPGSMKNGWFPEEERNKRWQKTGDQAIYPRYSTTRSDYTKRSDGGFTNASYIKLQMIDIAYSLPLKWLSKVKIKNCRLSLSVDNLGYITSYKGVDPETQMGFNATPINRTISTSLFLSL